MNKIISYRVRDLRDGSVVGYEWRNSTDRKWYHHLGDSTLVMRKLFVSDIRHGRIEAESAIRELFANQFAFDGTPIYVNDEIRAQSLNGLNMQELTGIVAYNGEMNECRLMTIVVHYSLNKLAESGYNFYYIRTRDPENFLSVEKPKPLNALQKGDKLSIGVLASLGFTKTFIPETEAPPLAEFTSLMLEESRFKGQMDKVVTRYVAGDRIQQTLTIAITLGTNNRDEFLVYLDASFIKKIHLVIELTYLIIDHLEIMDPELNELKTIWEST